MDISPFTKAQYDKSAVFASGFFVAIAPCKPLGCVFTKGSKRQSLLIVNVVLILLGYNGVKFDKKVCQKAI